VPEVLGYLGAGVLLGAHAGTVDADLVRGLGLFAVIFRMFTLGLDFDARRLRGQWRPALFAGGLEMVLCTIAGLGLAVLFGWPLLEGAILGAALGTTSTNILTKALADREMSSRADARAAGAATLAEDLIAMSLLALLTVFHGASGMGEVLSNALWLVVFAALAFSAGAILLPWMLDRLHRARSDELLSLAAIGVLFGFAGLSEALGAGRPMGAFLAGIAVGAARHAPGVSARVLPLRDVLAAVAYVSIGLLLDPATILAVAPAAALVALAFVPVKMIATSIGLRLGGVPAPTAARAGAILGQAGTMGLILACTPFLGLGASERLMAFAFVAWALTVGLTPLRLRYGPDVAERIARALGARDRMRTSGKLAVQVGARTRHDLYVAFLALGCAVGIVAVSTMAARAIAWAPRPTVFALSALAGALAAALVVPFSIVAGVAFRKALARGVHEAAMSPTRLARGRREGARTWAVTGTLLGIGVAFGLCALLILALSPAMERPALGAGALVGAILVVVRPRALEALVGKCESLVASERAVEARYHDFRGVHPFGVDVDGLVVRAGTRPAWAPLRELGLKGATGASVVAVLRGTAREPAPLAAETVVHPGDELVVAGTPAQLVAARRYLLDPARA
jgi:CPA2 family monovalent cation:H+ antiporter-2